MRVALILVIAVSVFVPASVFGFGYVAHPYSYTLEPGETYTFEFIVLQATAGAFHEVEVKGPGAEFYSYSNYTAVEGRNLVPITISIPEDYTGEKELEQTILVTQEPLTSEGMIVIKQQARASSSITVINIPTPPETAPVEPTKVVQECADGMVMKGGECVPEDQGGCLIVTAAYGSELAPQVQFLREIRDNTVLSTRAGASFMGAFNTIYYSFSPTIADAQRNNPMLNDYIKTILTPALYALNIMTLAESGSDLSVLTFGISTIGVILGMYVVAPVILVHKVKNRFRINV